MGLKETVQAAISSLQELMPNINELAAIEETRGLLQAKVAAAQAELDRVVLELKNKTAGLTSAQLQNVKDLEATLQGKRQELSTLTGQIEQAGQKLASLNVDVRSALERHGQLEASIDALRKRFA